MYGLLYDPLCKNTCCPGALNHIDSLSQDCSISIANALEILQSCTKPSISWHRKLICFLMEKGDTFFLLEWRHNEHDSVSNHQLLECLLNRLFWSRSQKTSKHRVTALCEGNPPVTSGFPVTWKTFSFDDVIMHYNNGCWWSGAAKLMILT